MKILVTSIIDLKRSAHSRLHEFVSYLALDHEVTVLSVRDWWKESQADTRSYEAGYESLWNNVDIRYHSDLHISPIIQELLSIFTVPRTLKRFNRDFDVHLNYNTLVSGLTACALLKSRGVPTVYDLADDLAAMIGASPQIPFLIRPLGAALARWLVRWNASLAKMVTVTTVALDVPTRRLDKIRLVPNGVDVGRFKRTQSEALRRRSGLSGAFVLGYVGVLREWIQLDGVLESISTLRGMGHNVKFLVVGEEGGFEAAQQAVRFSGLEEQVVFTGTVPYEEVPAYITCMDAGLIPFRANDIANGALPLKLMEYMACEVPVISTRLPAVEHAVGDNILYAQESAEIVRAVRLLIEDPVYASNLGREGRRLIEREFEWEKLREQMESVLIEGAVHSPDLADARA